MSWLRQMMKKEGKLTMIMPVVAVGAVLGLAVPMIYFGAKGMKKAQDEGKKEEENQSRNAMILGIVLLVGPALATLALHLYEEYKDRRKTSAMPPTVPGSAARPLA